VGAEARDYKTLIDAVVGVGADVVVRAASPWVKHRSALDPESLPPGMTLIEESISYLDLRQMYARADCVVVPLEAVEYAAGITTVIEAMALGKPVVCTATPGRDAALADGTTGLLVEPGSVESLRAAIRQVLENPSAAQAMGDRARDRVVSVASFEAFLGTVRNQLQLEQPEPTA
jgi:glycosyltransferase involved in cell wall biosynthesis